MFPAKDKSLNQVLEHLQIRVENSQAPPSFLTGKQLVYYINAFTLDSCWPNSSSFCCNGVLSVSVSTISVRILPLRNKINSSNETKLNYFKLYLLVILHRSIFARHTVMACITGLFNMNARKI